MIFSELLERRIRADGARPLLTCYYTGGARTELSPITYGNWVAKTASLIVDTLDVEAGETVALPVLTRHPGHWMGLVWVGACWTAGLQVVTDDSDAAGDPAISVAGPGLEFGPTGGHRMACSLHPLALGFTEPLPDGVTDWASEVKSEPDVFLGGPPSPADPAWDELNQREVLEAAAVTDRVLVDGRTGADPLALVRTVLVGPLLGGGSTVCLLDGDADAVATAERARVISAG